MASPAEPTRNWAGNVTFGPIRRPTTVDELCAIVAASDRIRAVGTGHSFRELVPTDGELVSVAGLPPSVTIDPEAAQVRLAGGLRYGDLVAGLDDAGWALANLGSLPHISVAGACATGTHGSGEGLGNLATAVAALDYVRADGSLVTVRRGDARFDGSVIALGALGVVVAVTLDLLPSFQLRQYVVEDLTIDDVRDHLAEVMAAAYSVSVFTDWSSAQIWRKQLATDPPPPDRWLGGRTAGVDRHPIPGLAATSCTAQVGQPGPWYARLPHFRLDHTPSAGDELQSEFFVPRTAGPAALAAVASLGALIRPVLHISELRAVASDHLWLSPAFERDSLAIHFTWISDAVAVAPVLAAVERALAPFDPRPHWGKLWTSGAHDFDHLYPRLADFVALRNAIDPAHTFTNPHLASIMTPGS